MKKIQNEEWLNALPESAVAIAEEINIETAKIIAERIKKIGKLSPSDIKRLTNSLEFLGADFKRITRLIAKYSKEGQMAVVDALKSAADSCDDFAKVFYSAKGIASVKWRTDPYLKRLVEAMARQTAAEFTNLSGTLAYKIDNRTLTLRQMYTRAIDKSIYEVQSGTVDYNTAMRKTVKQLSSDMRVLKWESGYQRRLDSHVRQNLIDGVKQLQQEMLDWHGERFGSDGVEISAHAISAPDHVKIQGRQLTNEEFYKMQSGQSFEDVNGNKYQGFPRPIGQWNCRHIKFPIVIGISEPTYTEEQLKEFAENSKQKYDLTQKQRAMETKLRQLKMERIAASAAGDELEAKRIQRKINEQQTIYRRFSEKHNLLYDTKRARVQEYRKISAIDNQNRNGILNDSGDISIKISQDVIDNIPLVKTETIPNELATSLQLRHKELLKIATKHPPNTEIGFVCDMNGNLIKTCIGDDGKSNVNLPSFNFPYITIHNHPSGKIHSHTDFEKILLHENEIISSVVGNNGKVYLIKKKDDFDGFLCYNAYYNKALPKLEDAILEKNLNKYLLIMNELIEECKHYGIEFNE